MQSPNYIFKILRAVAIGVGLYVLLSLSPLLILKLQGISLNRPQGVSEDSEPVYHDKKGKTINKAEYDFMVGYDAAKEKTITAHADCNSAYPSPQQFLLKEGCQKYVTEQKHFPPHVKQGHWDSGKTTAECRAEVNAYWDAQILDTKERGGSYKYMGIDNSPIEQELKECQNYDHVRILKVVYEPMNRLDALLEKLEQGGVASPEDRKIVRNDMQQVSTFPENQDTRAYFEKTDRFFQLADGLVKPQVEHPLQLSCEEFARTIEELRSAEKRDVDAQAALKQGNRISNGAQWDALNKSRIARAWDMKRYTDGAKSASCNIETKAQASEPRS